jgi:hypothetical protein
MTGKRKSAGNVGRAGRSEAELGQKEAGLEKTQAELETASEQKGKEKTPPRPLASRRRELSPNSANAQRAETYRALFFAC